MTRQKLWNIYTKRNPQFLTGPVHLTPEGLKKLFDQVWDQATKEETSKHKGKNFIEDAFGSMGMGFKL